MFTQPLSRPGREGFQRYSAGDVYVQTAGISKNGPISNRLFGWSDPRYHGDAMIMMNNELVPRILTWSEFVMFKPSY